MSECKHTMASIMYGCREFHTTSIVVETRRGVLDWRQRRGAIVSRCTTCREYLSLGPSRESYIEVNAAAVAATARDGFLGKTELNEEWPAGVVIGWTIHEDASVNCETYDVVTALSTRHRQIGYLARQIYVHSAENGAARPLSIEGQTTYMRILESYGGSA